MKTEDLLHRVHRIEIKTRALTQNIFAGEYHSAFKGSGVSFSEVREYQIGDEIRDIDWNVTARTNRPHIKIYEEERELTVILLIDVSNSLVFGTRGSSLRDLIIEISATLAFSADQNNDKIGVIFFSDRIEKFIPPKKGRKHILYIIRELLTLNVKSKHTNISLGLEYLLKVIPRKCITFILSDFISEQDYQLNFQLVARRHDLIVLKVFDPLHMTLPNLGLLNVEDAETGNILLLDTTNKKNRDIYQEKRNEEDKQFQLLCQKNNIDYVEISTGSNFIQSLLLLFRQR